MGITHESQEAITTDWLTPKWIFDALNLKFDLDPAAPIGGVSWIPAKRHYSAVENGLKKPWKGRVYLNPPYGEQLPLWLKRMHEHRDGIALLFSRTDCKWFYDYVTKADAILFIKGRIKFVDRKGVTGGSGAGSGSMLVAWGDDNVAALENMPEIGLLVKFKPEKYPTRILVRDAPQIHTGDEVCLIGKVTGFRNVEEVTEIRGFDCGSLYPLDELQLWKKGATPAFKRLIERRLRWERKIKTKKSA